MEGEPKGEGDGKVEGEGEEDQTEEEVEETQQGKRKREGGDEMADKKKGKKAAKEGAAVTDTYKAGQYVVLKADLAGGWQEAKWRIVEIVKTESSDEHLLLTICYMDKETRIESTVDASKVSCTTNKLLTYC